MKRYRAYAWFDIQVKKFYEVESETDEDAREQIEELISEDGANSITASRAIPLSRFRLRRLSIWTKGEEDHSRHRMNPTCPVCGATGEQLHFASGAPDDLYCCPHHCKIGLDQAVWMSKEIMKPKTVPERNLGQELALLDTLNDLLEQCERLADKPNEQLANPILGEAQAIVDNPATHDISVEKLEAMIESVEIVVKSLSA